MAFTSRTRLVNPRLGTYFGIFAAAFAALVLLALMFEQLGVADAARAAPHVRRPDRALCGDRPAAPRAARPSDYFACGRRVPAFFNGLVLAVTRAGRRGLPGAHRRRSSSSASTRCASASAGAPASSSWGCCWRRSCASSAPTRCRRYLGRRFESRTVRVVAAAVLCRADLLLLLAAEARLAAYAAAWLLGQPERLMAVVVVACAAAIVLAGGMRSLTWSSVAKAIAALLALAVPVTIVALMVSNLPLPQMTHGNVLRVLTRMEIARGVPIVAGPAAGVRPAGRGRRAARQALHPGLRQRRQPGLRADVAGGGGRHRRLAVAAVAAGHDARRLRGAQVARLGGAGRRRRAADAAGRRRLPARAAARAGGRPAGRPPAGLVPDAAAGRASPAIEATGADRAASPASASSATRSCSRCPIAAGFPQVLVYLALAGAPGGRPGRRWRPPLVAIAAIVSEDVVHGLRGEPAAGRAPASARRALPCWARAFVDGLAGRSRRRPIRCSCSCGRSTLSASTVFPGAGAVDLVEAHQRLGRHRRHDRRPCGRGARHPARRSGRLGAAERRWPAPSACRRRSPPPSCASMLTPAPGRSVARHRARDARAGRRDALRPRAAPAAPQDPRAGLRHRIAAPGTCLSARSPTPVTQCRRASCLRLQQRHEDTTPAMSARSGSVSIPPIEPYRHERLKVGGGHEIYFEECGNPQRQAGADRAWRPRRRLQLHHAPLSRSGALPHRAVRPARLRPLDAARQPGGQHHLAPGRRHGAAARRTCGIERWQLFGGSWGSTLALAYAQTHPERVSDLILRGIFLLRREELDWFYQDGCSWLFPEAFEEFRKVIPPERARRHDRRLLPAPHRSRPRRAARRRRAWSIWEGSTLSLLQDPERVQAVRRRQLRHRLRPHRVPLLRQPRLLRARRPAARRRRPHPPPALHHRARPLRRGDAGQERLGPDARLAARPTCASSPTPATP